MTFYAMQNEANGTGSDQVSTLVADRYVFVPMILSDFERSNFSSGSISLITLVLFDPERPNSAG